MIRISPSTTQSAPAVGSIEVADDEWRLDPTRYRQFITETTGYTVTADPCPSECYRIGNRLEAFVEERKRAGEWSLALVDGYPEVESLDEIIGLARFFRECHACCLGEC